MDFELTKSFKFIAQMVLHSNKKSIKPEESAKWLFPGR